MANKKTSVTTVGDDSCAVYGIHEEIIRGVQQQWPGAESLEALAEFYRLFGDKTRLGIIWALSVHEMCVCDLCELLKMQQSAVSHQLRTLKLARIVRSRREGKMVFYALDDDHIRDVLGVGYEHLKERG
ncbi:MAG: metalloregulator ArsR/SmtB family transcription factor [Desulfuromonadaceae bacterium]|nr:metalloregulator ArsR/SmtB family transcription factor [Desulfuromonadaceae bacterium]